MLHVPTFFEILCLFFFCLQKNKTKRSLSLLVCATDNKFYSCMTTWWQCMMNAWQWPQNCHTIVHEVSYEIFHLIVHKTVYEIVCFFWYCFWSQNHFDRNWQNLPHCLGMRLLCQFFFLGGGLGSNEFHIKGRFGTHGSWKNQNPGGRFGATS